MLFLCLDLCEPIDRCYEQQRENEENYVNQMTLLTATTSSLTSAKSALYPSKFNPSASNPRKLFILFSPTYQKRKSRRFNYRRASLKHFKKLIKAKSNQSVTFICNSTSSVHINSCATLIYSMHLLGLITTHAYTLTGTHVSFSA